MDKNGKITIIDVARKAGVSKGTVDRVVHNRGEVSKKSAEKVKKAIEELRYQPNLYASLLASKKAHVIACLLPTFGKGEYWEKLHAGFLHGGESVASLNVRTRVFQYDQYDPDSFARAADEMLDSAPSGVILPPLFKSDTMELAERLKEQGIPYVYVDTRLEDPDYFAYYGMPMYKSGRLCAFLLTERLSADDVRDVAIVRITRDKTRRSDPTLERRSGFLDFMDANFPECRIHQVFIDPNDPEGIPETKAAFAADNPGIKLIVMFNSRIHLISGWLAANPAEGRRVIGFDDLEKNLEAVRSDLVDVLITEHVENQSFNAVNVLSDYILMYKRPAVRDNYMHMDILTKYNLEHY